jgi:hypothetical protein
MVQGGSGVPVDQNLYDRHLYLTTPALSAQTEQIFFPTGAAASGTFPPDFMLHAVHPNHPARPMRRAF